MADMRSIPTRWIEVWGEDDPATPPPTIGFVPESPFGRIEGRDERLDIVSVRSCYDTRNLPHFERH